MMNFPQQNRRKFLDWLGRPDDMGGTFAARDARAELGEPNVYRNPYPPQAGRRVADQLGQVWVLDSTGDVARDDDRSIILTWGQLLATGPVTLLRLTDDEIASEPLYGPVGARWGTPGTPCAYEGCALDSGHASVHLDADGNPLGVTTEATETYVDPPRGTMLSRICTCGHPQQHLPGCARYVTPMTDTIPSALEPTGWTHTVEDMPNGSKLIVSEPVEKPATPAPARKRTARKSAPRKATTTTPTPARKRAPRKAT